MHVVFDESNAFSKEKSIEEDDDVGLAESLNDMKLKDKTRESDKLHSQQKEEENLMEGSQAHNGNTLNLPIDLHFSHAYPKEQVLDDHSQGAKTRESLKNIYNNMAFLYQIEPKSFKEAEKDDS